MCTVFFYLTFIRVEEVPVHSDMNVSTYVSLFHFLFILLLKLPPYSHPIPTLAGFDIMANHAVGAFLNFVHFTTYFETVRGHLNSTLGIKNRSYIGKNPPWKRILENEFEIAPSTKRFRVVLLIVQLCLGQNLSTLSL
jgi:hypothetical protein